jgi:hypothetical protein
MTGMTHREKAGLRGSVVYCETEQRRIDPFSNDTTVTRESFQRDGHRSELAQSGAVSWSQRWIYDVDGRLLEEFLDGAFASRRTFSYDVTGRLEQVRVRDAAGERLEESWTYYDDGASLHTHYPHLPGVNCCVSAESMLHISADAARIMTLRDSRGNSIEKVLYSADDRPIQRVLFRYDGSGRLSEEGEADFDNRIRPDFRNLFRYDALGRCVLREMHCSFGSERNTTSYNEQGDVSETRRIPLFTEANAHLDCFPPESWASVLRYDYDVSGNWTSCHTETRVSGKDEIAHREEKHRRVEYS